MNEIVMVVEVMVLMLFPSSLPVGDIVLVRVSERTFLRRTECMASLLEICGVRLMSL